MLTAVSDINHRESGGPVSELASSALGKQSGKKPMSGRNEQADDWKERVSRR